MVVAAVAAAVAGVAVAGVAAAAETRTATLAGSKAVLQAAAETSVKRASAETSACGSPDPRKRRPDPRKRRPRPRGQLKRRRAFCRVAVKRARREKCGQKISTVAGLPSLPWVVCFLSFFWGHGRGSIRGEGRAPQPSHDHRKANRRDLGRGGRSPFGMGVGRPRGAGGRCGGFQQSKRRCRVGVGVVFASCLFASSRRGRSAARLG